MTQQNDALYQRIRAGDKAAIDEMIVASISLAEKRVDSFLRKWRRFEHLREDLISVSLLALTEAVNSFVEKEADSPAGYVKKAIDYALKNHVDSEIGSGLLSRSSVQHRRARGQPLPRRLPIDPARPPARLWANANGRVVRKEMDCEMPNGEISDSEIPASKFGSKTKGVSHTDADQLIACFQHDEATDVLDQIFACCETEEDEEIVRLRMKNYTDAEIAEQLGISRQTVNRRREKIEQRFEKKKAAQ